MTARATAFPGGRAATTQAQPRRRRLRRRHLWLVPGLALAIYANALGERNGVGIPALIAFGIAPHLPLLLRLGQRRGGGGLRSLVVPLFNLLHHPVAALAAVAVAATGVLSPVVLVASLVWFSHIVVGWGIGDGMRQREVPAA
jgi:hypothetical protein